MYQTYVHHNIRKEITVTLQSKQKHMYNDSGHELETHIYILIKMMSVKTHGGKTIRSEVTQHTQKNLQRNFFSGQG